MKDQFSMQESPGRRAAAYWFVDGFPEIVLGVALILSAVAGILWDLYGPGRADRRGFAGFLIVSAGFALYYYKERSILDFLKSRVTYPRTGFVQPPEEVEGRVCRPLIVLSVQPAPARSENVTFFRQRVVMLLWWFFYPFLINGNLSEAFGRWLLPCMMPLLAILLFVVNRNSERRYSGWWLLVLAISGLPFLAWHGPSLVVPLAALLLAGVWMLAKGVYTLAGYLDAHPLPPTTAGVKV
jgi:hypothetical protein